jgi:hypothetical protein
MALHKIRSGEHEFSCNAISEAYDKIMYSKATDFTSNAICDLFPEFIAQKPEKQHSNNLWWDHKEFTASELKEMRIKVLQKCITDIYYLDNDGAKL